ncbi:hypothetical protein SAMN04488135_110160 [Pollutimonas bauzanensis]|uniref:Uncharacterized protein n=2 Tax=Pollutimonas bauzanensis TaxID=658167 RepID=A0A1M5YTW5_9BURK|nr:hypothetical protein SAMN04488135_110160 [Pollutimonas bauzanensis]
MRFIQYSSSALLALALTSTAAYAGLCEAPFMHDGGQAQLSGSGGMQLGADLSFSDVRKDGADSCEARVQGTATFGLAGLPPGKSSLDYWMAVKSGKASFERRDAQGKREPVNGKFDLRMLGLFAYGAPVTKAGQTFPAMRFQINVDHKAVQTQPIVVNTGLKKVGERQTIQTATGSQSCWPIRYTRITDPTQASFNGLVLPVPGMTSAVTDWFCPDVHMVMKQESEQSGVASVVEVTKLR